MKLLHHECRPLHIPHDFLIHFDPQEHFLSFDPYSVSLAKSETGIPSIVFSTDAPLPNSHTISNCHGNHVVKAGQELQKADGHYSIVPRKQQDIDTCPALALCTADCLAIALYFENETLSIGALVHAGWRGLTSGIIQNALAILKRETQLLGISEGSFIQNLKAFIAPAIFGVSYECGADVKDALSLHQKMLFSNYSLEDPIYTHLYNLCANVQQESSESVIFPDIQLLAVLEFVVSGLLKENISVLRENTYDHSVLHSYRRSCHENRDPRLRNWTHLYFSEPPLNSPFEKTTSRVMLPPFDVVQEIKNAGNF